MMCMYTNTHSAGHPYSFDVKAIGLQRSIPLNSIEILKNSIFTAFFKCMLAIFRLFTFKMRWQINVNLYLRYEYQVEKKLDVWKPLFLIAVQQSQLELTDYPVYVIALGV